MLKSWLSQLSSKLSGQPMHHAVFSRHGFLRCGAMAKPLANKQVQTGFTLLEMMVVIGLLGIVALASTTLLEDNGYIEEAKKSHNENNWPLIRKAIVGDASRTLNGEAELSGFVADMGRLPNCLRELLEPLECDDDIGEALELALWSQDAESQVWSGWNGPYLQGLPAAGGLKFRDAWGNVGKNPLTATPANYDTRNYGWLFGTGAPDGTACEDAVVTQPKPDNLILQSCGQDKKVGGGDDYPALVAGGIPNLINESDYRVFLGDEWNNIKYIWKNEPTTKETLRLRINYPVDGLILNWTDEELNTPDERDASPFLSAAFPAFDINNTSLVLAAKTDEILIAPAGSSLAATTLTIPIDGELVLTDGSVLKLTGCATPAPAAPCSVTVPSDLVTVPTGTTSGVSSTFKIGPTNGDIVVPRSNISEIQANITGLAKFAIYVPLGSTVTPSQITLPNGATLAVSQNVVGVPPNILLSNESVTVSEAFVLEGNVVTTKLSGDQFNVPPDTTVDGNKLTIPRTIYVPMGQRTMSIVCEGSPEGVGGQLFDGNCSNDTNPNGHQPIAQPYSLTVVPRQVLKKPVLLPWNIQ